MSKTALIPALLPAWPIAPGHASTNAALAVQVPASQPVWAVVQIVVILKTHQVLRENVEFNPVSGSKYYKRQMRLSAFSLTYIAINKELYNESST